MRPSNPLTNRPYRAVSQAELGCEHGRPVSGREPSAYLKDIIVGQLGHRMPTAYRRRSVGSAVSGVAFAGSPSEIFKTTIRCIAVVVARLMFWWARSNERLKNQPIDVGVPHRSVVYGQSDNWATFMAFWLLDVGGRQLPPIAQDFPSSPSLSSAAPYLTGIVNRVAGIIRNQACSVRQFWNIHLLIICQ